MSLVNFYRGIESNYNAELHLNSVYLCTDSNSVYIFGIKGLFVPKDGHERLILSWKASGEAKWEDLANVFTGLEEILAYGVQWDTTVSDPHLTRIGNMSLHKTLPILSQLKGCIALGDQVIYWLDENDWKWRKNPITLNMTLAVSEDVYTIVNDLFADNRYKNQWLRINNISCKVIAIDTGSTTATLTPDETIEAGNYDVELGAVLNGYDGTVRVYCPNFYIKSYIEGDIRKVYISTVKIDASWTYQHEILVDAYRCTVLNTVPENMGYLSTLPVNSLISVVNTDSYCRGGDNRIANDTYLTTDQFRSDLGKPRTNINRVTARTYARNAGSELLSYEQYKNIFYWLWVIEYANFNSQDTFNEELTSEGYRQGGMGPGINSFENWLEFNGLSPITPCGFGNSLGNNTGIITIDAFDFEYVTNTILNMSNYVKYSDSAVITNSDTSVVVSEILQANTRYLARGWSDCTGDVIYNIVGLQSGQTIEFVTNNNIIATAKTDGNITVSWPTEIKGDRLLRSQFTGECNITISIVSASTSSIQLSVSTKSMPRWRGFDNPFGDIWTNLDGVLIDTPTTGASDTNILPICYIITDPEKYTDSLDGIEEVADRSYKQPHSEGYIGEWHLGEAADMVPESTGGNTTQYKCDHYLINYNDTPKTLLMGGHANYNSRAGLGNFVSAYLVSSSSAFISFRSASDVITFYK